MNEESIFNAAIEKDKPDEREAYLDEACGDDAELQARVEALLAAHDNPDSFLDRPADPDETVDLTLVTERPGATIGRYKLREQVGEGGMGVVFVAEQEKPVRRKVALKVIKPGMDTKEVIARFEAERQALAMMDHPNIAKVLDAGSTESGRPYFVMELVRGIPITEYCDQNKLTVRERLELFTQVCNAIQHAHQKAVIHRDIKPSNVIVSVHDDTPVPKVIDFGVAKAIDQELAQRTIYTQFHQVLGTPMYMSPEQAGQSDLDVDTRSDVYSLGVLLYELVTGVTPFELNRFEKILFDEIRRIIREEEPPKPSTRISALGATAPAVSADRRTDPQKLRQLVSGDLDWVVMRALEKDRTRRYETASAFAKDIERYNRHEPVDAGPPSAVYRFCKYLRRNKGPVTAVTAVFAAWIVGFLGIVLMLAHARDEAERARQAERKVRTTLESLHEEIIDRALESIFRGERQVAEEMIEKAKDSGVSDGWICFLRGLANFYDGETKEAVRDLDMASRLEPDNPSALAMLAVANLWNGQPGLFLEQVTKLRKLSPREEYEQYDKMFLAFAEVYHDPKAAAKQLEHLVRERPTWNIARAWLAAAFSHTALDSGEAAYADRAIEELRILKKLLPDTPSIIMGDLWAHCIAIQLKNECGDRSNDLRAEAGRLAKLMQPHNRFPLALIGRAMYFDLSGRPELTYQERRKAARLNYDQHRFAALAFELGRVEEAMDVVLLKGNPLQNSFTELVLAQLQVEQLSQHDALADQCVAVLQSDLDVKTRFLALNVLLLLGRLADVDREIQRSSFVSGGYVGYQVPPNLVEDTEAAREQLLNDAGSSRVARHKTLYLVGLVFLAKGRKIEAQKHFEECVACGQINWSFHYWARAYAERIRLEPTWPSWIPDTQARP